MRVRTIGVIGSCILSLGLLTEVVPTAAASGRTGIEQQNGDRGQSGGRPGGQQGGGRPGGGQPGGGRPPQGGSNGGSRPGGPPQRPNPGGRPPGGNPGAGGGPRPQPGRPVGGRPPVRPSRPPSRPSYSFGDGGNGWRLRHYFNGDMARINRNRRPHFFVGSYFPRQYVTLIQPIPPDVYGYLPPPPPGYAMGYYDGYTVVYDPATLLIASVLDLFRY